MIEVPIPSDYVAATMVYRSDPAARARTRDRGGWPPPMKYIPTGLTHEIRQWLYENDIRATLVMALPRDPEQIAWSGLVLRFNDPDDAFAFRMRWSKSPRIPRRVWT